MKVTKTILRKVEKLCNIHLRERPDGNWEVYKADTDEVLEVVPKEDVESAIKRHNFKVAQKKRRKEAKW